MKYRIIRIIAAVTVGLIIMNGCGNTGQDNRIDKSTDGVTEAAESETETDKDTGKKTDRKNKDKKKKDRSEKNPAAEEPETEKQEESDPPEKKREKNWKGHEEVFAEYDGIYRKLNKGKDVSILINGDSIGAGGGSTDGNSWLRCVPLAGLQAIHEPCRSWLSSEDRWYPCLFCGLCPDV